MSFEISAVEIAQALARLGVSDIIFITSSKHILLEHEDTRTQDIIKKILEDDGVKVILDCDVHKCVQNGDGDIELYYSAGHKEINVDVDAVFVSSGKLPNVSDISLDLAEVKFDAYKGVESDDELRTSNKNIFAIGGCTSHVSFS